MFSNTVLSAVLAALLGSSVTAAEGAFKIPLSVSRGFTNAYTYPKIAYNKEGAMINQNSGKGAGVYTMENFEYISYTANFSVGTPPQEVQLILDTGSSDPWVFDPSASAISDAEYSIFDPDQSSSLEWNGTYYNITYGLGYSFGQYARDNWTFGEITLPQMTFGISTEADSGPGIMGIGYEHNQASFFEKKIGSNAFNSYSNVSFTYSNLPSVLVESGAIASRLYSVWLNTRESAYGEITFGGIDTDKFYGELAVVPLSIQNPVSAFFIHLNNFVIDDTLYSSQIMVHYGQTKKYKSSLGVYGVSQMGVHSIYLPVLLDTGTTLTYLPRTMAKGIISRLSNHHYTDVGAWGKPCSKLAETSDITWNFANNAHITVLASDIYFTAEEYLGRPYFDSNGEAICFIGIAPGEYGYGIFGDSFLRSAYVVYDLDNEVIGLAQAVETTANSSIVTVDASGLKGNKFVGTADNETRIAYPNLHPSQKNAAPHAVNLPTSLAIGTAALAVVLSLF